MKKPKKSKITAKQIHHKHFFVAGIAAFFLTGILLGAFFVSQNSAHRAFADLHVFKPGQTISNDLYDVRIDDVSTGNGEQGSMKPSANKTYLIVNLYVKNKSSKSLSLYPVTQSYIKDDQGSTYGIGPAMVTQPFQGGNIISGDKIKGQIAYEIPSSLKHPRFYLEGLAELPVIIQL
jgi:hypothetical protein